MEMIKVLMLVFALMSDGDGVTTAVKFDSLDACNRARTAPIGGAPEQEGMVQFAVVCVVPSQNGKRT